MLKSEAIEILEEILDTDGKLPSAEFILSELTKMGMYPPCRRDGKYDWEIVGSVPKMSPTRSITDGNKDS